MKVRISGIGILCLFVLGLSGCTHQQGASRAATGAMGAITGATAGALLRDGDPRAVLLGGVVGAGAGEALWQLTETSQVKAMAWNDGYVMGQGDSIKRHFFLLQQLHEAQPQKPWEVVYYDFPIPREGADGLQLAPATVTLPVIEGRRP